MNALCTDFGWKGNRFSGYLSVDIHRNGELAARGTARFSCVPPPPTAALRGDRGRLALTRPLPRRTPVPAHTTGRLLPFGRRPRPHRPPRPLALNPDLDHPILFEHANDHHPRHGPRRSRPPGRQRPPTPTTFTPAAIATEFHHYAELDAPCWIDATLTTPGHVHITGHQENRTIFHSTVTATTT